MELKELIKKAFEDEKFVELFKKYCVISQKFADCLLWHHNELSNKLLDKYPDNWITDRIVYEIIEDDELIELSEIYRYIRF